MGLKEAFANFKRNFCNYQEYEDKLSLLQEGYKLKQKLYDDLSKTSHHQDNLIFSKNELIEVKDAIIKEYESQAKGMTPVDDYCQAKGYRIDNFAYKDKIIINGVKIPCNMREM